MKKLVLTAVLSSLFSLNANAASFTQRDLMNRMTSPNPVHRAFAEGYIMGIAEGVIGERLMCTSGSIHTTTLLNFVLMRLSAHPQEFWDTSAGGFVRAQLILAYPCPWLD